MNIGVICFSYRQSKGCNQSGFPTASIYFPENSTAHSQLVEYKEGQTNLEGVGAIVGSTQAFNEKVVFIRKAKLVSEWCLTGSLKITDNVFNCLMIIGNITHAIILKKALQSFLPHMDGLAQQEINVHLDRLRILICDQESLEIAELLKV